jgi:hypothetical protein
MTKSMDSYINAKKKRGRRGQWMTRSFDKEISGERKRRYT